MKDFPLPSGPIAWVVFALVFAGLAGLALRWLEGRSAIKRASRSHLGFDSVVDRLRKGGGA